MVQVLSNNDDDYNNSNNNTTNNNILIVRLSPLLSPTPVLPISSTSCASFASENPNEQTRYVLCYTTAYTGTSVVILERTIRVESVIKRPIEGTLTGT